MPADRTPPPGAPGARDDAAPERGKEPPNLEDSFHFMHEHRVRYDEVDAQGIVGAASWMQILQLARTQYLRAIGLMLEGGARTPVQAVVRRSVVEHLSPARFDDALLIRVRVAQLGERSARFDTIVDNVDTGLRPVMAETTLVCIDAATFRSLPWPRVFRDRVAALQSPPRP